MGAIFSSVEEIITDAERGRMFIVVDDEARENEGDLVIPAQFADPIAINFMAVHGRGLICLALTEAKVKELGLSLLPGANQSRLGTAFTTSIEAKKGVTTGISAADRAHTIKVAIADEAADSITSPGHVFPLAAKRGGGLVRAGHTEAACDIAAAAALKPYGVICEIMNDDGSMARLPDLEKFASVHGLKIVSIAQLIAWRLRREKLVACVEKRDFKGFGREFVLHRYRSKIDDGEHFALVKGEVGEETLVRVQTVDIVADVLGGSPTLRLAMERIAVGGGVLVVVGKRKPTPDVPMPLKEYGIGAQVLNDLGVKKMKLLSSHSPPPITALEGYGLSVVGFEKLEASPGARGKK